MTRIPDGLRDLRKRFAQRRSKGLMADKQRELFRADTPPDVTSVLTKRSRHRKSTADRWNQ